MTALLFIVILFYTSLSSLIAIILFSIASVSDYFDGYLARRFHAITPLGIFLDLTADKVLVSVVLIALVQIGFVPAWIAAIIVAREFLVSGLRSVAGTQGRIIPAGKLGKQKTFITLVAIGGILVARYIGAPPTFLFPTYFLFKDAPLVMYLLTAADTLLLVGVLLTLLSAIEYFILVLPFLRITNKGGKS